MKLHLIYGAVVLLLLGTCGYLLFSSIDTAINLSYRDQQVAELDDFRKQVTAALPGIAAGMGKSEVVAAMERAGREVAFEKDGCTWVGRVGMKFSPQGKLVHVSPGWSYGEADPCYPR